MADDNKPKFVQKKNANPKSGELANYVFGKVQPQALVAEEAVLGALMLDKEALPEVMDSLSSDSFYLDKHQMIYKAIIGLFERSHPVDLLTVKEELSKSGELEAVGGAYYLVELTNRVGTSANIEFHARIIAQKHIMRELIRVSTKIIKEAYEETTDVFDLLDGAEKGLFDITQNNLSRQYEGMGSLASKLHKQLEELRGREEGLTGIPSGFVALDRLTSGWQRSDLVILAGRPGMGKTSFVLSLARNAASIYNNPVAVFSLEMSKIQIVQRILSMEAQISASKLRTGQLEDYEWEQLNTAIEKISEYPIFIDDTPGINIFEVRAKCRRMKMQHNIELVVIDYLQLMSGGKDNKQGNREQEISSISRSLKEMAKELEIPVIALAQLSRSVETRGGDKRPQLSDLRESGAIEQDADIVSFVYRPEYYKIEQDEDGNSLKGIAEIIIAKHRNGATDTVKLKFTGELALFSNHSDYDFLTGAPSFVENKDPFGGNVVSLPSKINDDTDTPF